MTAHVVIAVRGGPEAKSRLADRLAPGQRAALVEAMLADMLQALAGSPAIARVYVTTSTPDLAHIAARAGAVVILEYGASALNAAFDSVRRRIAQADPTRTIVLLPGDLPLLDAAELEAAISQAGETRMALAPAAADGGTGAVILRADCPLSLAFGPDSFKRHLAAAAALGLEVAVVEAPGLALDVDRPEDLDAVVAHGRGRTAALLRGWRLAA